MSEPDASAQLRARGHFDRGRQAAEAGDFDRAIEAYVEGLRLAPDDVSGGHIELRVLALQRLERGGAKPTDEEVSQRLSAGTSPLDRMLNAEYLLAKDPNHVAYGEAVLRAAVAGGYREAARWMADLMFLANNNAKKPQVRSLRPAKGLLCGYRTAGAGGGRVPAGPHAQAARQGVVERLQAAQGQGRRRRPKVRRRRRKRPPAEAVSPAAPSPAVEDKKPGETTLGAVDAQALAEAKDVFRQGAHRRGEEDSTISPSTCTWMG